MLWALAFVAVPIIIHFFQRRRTIRLDFSSIRFLKESAVIASRRKRLRRLLLLLARIAMLAVIVVLFAQPYNPFDPFGALRNPQGRTYVWVDPTISMDYRDDGVALWEIAGRCVALLDSMLPKSRKLFVFDECGGRFADRDEPRQAACPPVRHGPTNLGEMLREFNRRRRGDGHVPALVLISDFQAHDTAILDTFLFTDTLGFPVLFVTVAPRRPYNYAVEVVSPPSRQQSYVRCAVRAYGRELRPAGLSVLSGTLRTGHEQTGCGRDTAVEVQVETSVPEPMQPAEVRLEADDPFMHDNTAYFVTESNRPVRVLVVAENESAFPVVAAYRSLSQEQGYDTRTAGALSVGFDDLDSAEVIILAGLSVPSRPLQALFSGHSLERKVILFSPGMDGKHAALNGQVLGSLGRKDAGYRMVSGKTLFPVLPDTVSMLWRGFPRREDKSVCIDAYLAPMPGTALVRLSDGGVMAAYAADSAGHCWILFSTPICIDKANNLGETGFFVPLLDRLTRFGLSMVGRGPRQWIAGVLQRNPFFGTGAGADIFDAEGRAIARWSSQAMVGFEKPGAYKIQPASQSAYWVAVRCSPEESSLSYTRPAAPKNAQRYVKVMDAAGLREFLRGMRGGSRLNLLWIILGVLALAEVFLWEKKRMP